jgi:hypothetical protein
MHKHYNGEQLKNVLDLIQSYDKFEKLSINDFMTIISH